MYPLFRPHSANAERTAFAARLVALLRKRDMTQSDLARALGVSRDAVSAWARGRSLPEPANVARIAQALGVEPTALVGAAPATAAQASPGPDVVHLQVDPHTGAAVVSVQVTLDLERATALLTAIRSVLNRT